MYQRGRVFWCFRQCYLKKGKSKSKSVKNFSDSDSAI